MVVAGGVAAVALLALGYFVGLKGANFNNLNLGNVPFVSSPPTPIPPQSADPTANWKTYVDSQKRFSFQYPPTMSVEENKTTHSIYRITNTDTNEKPGMPLNSYLIEINLAPADDLKTFKQRAGIVEMTGEKIAVTIKDIKIDGYPAVEVEYPKGYEQNKNYFIEGKNINVLIAGTGTNGGTYHQVLDQILGTFKFTEQNNNTPTPSQVPVLSKKLLSTVGWRIASNNTFSVKYPADIYNPQIMEKSIQLVPKTNVGNDRTKSPDFLVADNYSGGSRRGWYANTYSFYPSEVAATEVLLGNISALEVRPNSQKTIDSILVTKGNTLLGIKVQSADLQTVETMVSTIVFK